jgi:hypothetical protein
MRLLVSSGDVERRVGGVGGGDCLDVGVDLAGDEAFEAADCVAFRVSIGDTALEVGDGRRVTAAQADHHDGPERGVRVAIAGSVESSTIRVARGDGHGGGATQRREAAFGGVYFRVADGRCRRGNGVPRGREETHGSGPNCDCLPSMRWRSTRVLVK